MFPLTAHLRFSFTPFPHWDLPMAKCLEFPRWTNAIRDSLAKSQVFIVTSGSWLISSILKGTINRNMDWVSIQFGSIPNVACNTRIYHRVQYIIPIFHVWISDKSRWSLILEGQLPTFLMIKIMQFPALSPQKMIPTVPVRKLSFSYLPTFATSCSRPAHKATVHDVHGMSCPTWFLVFFVFIVVVLVAVVAVVPAVVLVDRRGRATGTEDGIVVEVEKVLIPWRAPPFWRILSICPHVQ